MVLNEYYHGSKILKTHSERYLRLVVLIPHRDARGPLQSWSGELFTKGLPGAYSFPQVLPLAVVSHAFSAGELTGLAHALRDLGTSGGGDGMFRTGEAETALVLCPGGDITIYGPVLDFRLSETFFGEAAAKIVYRPSPLVIGAAVLGVNEKLPAAIPPLPKISFRAAALANMIYRPLESGDSTYSFKWKIGKYHWLPSIKKKKLP
jgi:hypothetical protein